MAVYVIDWLYRSEEHIDMFKAYVIEALERLFDQTSCQAQLISTSAKTAKLAKAFVKKQG